MTATLYHFRTPGRPTPDWKPAKGDQYYRLECDDHTITLTELPTKPCRRKLREHRVRVWDATVAQHQDQFLTPNLLARARLNPLSGFDEAVDRLRAAVRATYNDLCEEDDGWEGFGLDFLVQCHTREVYYLEVRPVDCPDLKIELADTTLLLAWEDFQVQRPGSTTDYGDGESHYSQIVHKSKGAARKLYKLLAADPDRLKNTSYSQIYSWLETHGIGYDVERSTWT